MFIDREITAVISLGTGDFGEAGKNTVTLEGYRITAGITKGGLPSLDTANISIFGLSKSLMNQLTRLGKPLAWPRDNTITLTAGDAESGMSHIFSGTIINSYSDFEGMPDVSLNLVASSGLLALAKPVTPLSFAAGVDVATIASRIAESMGKSFMNSGVTQRLNGPVYLPGTAVDQLRKLKDTANIDADMNGGPTGETLEIWPVNKPRGSLIPNISKDSGLIGYPRYSDMGIGIRAIYRPGWVYAGRFNLETEIAPAAGTWQIISLVYDLESKTPGGAWFMDIVGARTPEDGGSYE